MKSFLQEVVVDLLKRHDDFSQIVLVVPGMRPKAFIRKVFIEEGFQGILPEIVSIEELLEKITSLKAISGIPLWFTAYNAYKANTDNDKTFDDFIKFAPTLLKDFDDIDASMTDHLALFDMMVSEERIKNWGKSMDVGLSDIMQNHLGFWTDAKSLFYALRTDLLHSGMAYRGLLAKKAAEQTSTYLNQNLHNFVLIGFNALTQSEQKILFQMTEADRATAYWDADTYYLENTQQEAGDFLRAYQSYFGDKFKFINANFEKPKNITIYDVPKQETQAKLVGNLLDQLSDVQKNKTAIVLGDEQLLPAVLNSLPDSIEKINITMGLPLSSIPMANFFKELILLHANREKFNLDKKFYFQNVLNILTDNNFSHFFHPYSKEIINNIRENNAIFYGEDALTRHGQIFEVFRIPASIKNFPSLIIDWLNHIQATEEVSDFQSEYLFRFRSIFQQLDNYLKNFASIEHFKSFHQLFNQLLQSESIAFVGEPLVGLQLLGMLETRLLDFENVIVTSVNEGTLPLGRQENTLIPFDFRKRFSLNTFMENDAIYAYHFYRLLQRTSNATLIYNSDSEGLGSGEPSRFLLQLLMESPHNIKQITASPAFYKREQDPLHIAKTPYVLEKLNLWKERISPSALGTYLWNPINFYKRYVLDLKEEDEVEEFAGDMTLGTIIHNTLERIYKPYVGTVLSPEIFKKINQEKNDIFEAVVDEALLKGNEVRGKNILILKVAKEMIENVLQKDLALCQDNELIIKLIEPSMQVNFLTPNGHQVNFKGKIDRVDEVNQITRVLDYKTGHVDAYQLSYNDKKVDKIYKDKESGKAIQLSIYALMYLNENPTEESLIAGIYPLRYFSKDIQALQWDKNELIDRAILENFLQSVGYLIDEILDPEIPFMQPEE